MKFSRNCVVWSVLALCAAVVVGAMCWLTRDVLASEAERTAAEARADLEERTRLALWRMDAEGAAMIAAESRIPPEGYLENRSLQSDASPKRRFVWFEGGDPVSVGDDSFLARLDQGIRENSLPVDAWAMLFHAADLVEVAWNNLPMEAHQQQVENVVLRQSMGPSQVRQQAEYQANSNEAELSQRAKTIQSQVAAFSVQAPEPEEPAPLLPMRGVWVGGELFLLRQVATRQERGVQGAWLDAEFLKERLLAEVNDLLPAADLTAVEVGPGLAPDPLALVSFPFRLVRNERYQAAAPALSRPLVIGWMAVLVALATASLLVQGVMRLSERRASFVSAVTHELRTPLTTFRLYSDMLEQGVVAEVHRGEYLRVLSREADRLAHLVENVLAFSRIERGSARSVTREMKISDLLESMRERFEARIASAGLRLAMDLGEVAEKERCRVDAAAVEHILFNLVDNAAKHAADSDPPVVRIGVSATAAGMEITVRDHGPGIPETERRRIFRPFHKSAREAAETRPGVGLGLALSRRLARSHGWRLRYQDAHPGASFVLELGASIALPGRRQAGG